jgi:hypothetical protein
MSASSLVLKRFASPSCQNLRFSRLIGPVSVGGLFSSADTVHANAVMEVDPVWCTIRYSSTLIRRRHPKRIRVIKRLIHSPTEPTTFFFESLRNVSRNLNYLKFA